MLNSAYWFNAQPRGIWLKIDDIPYEIFYSIWDNYIETYKVELHDKEAKFLIKT